MRVRVSSKDLSQLKADLAVCFAFDGDKTPRGIAEIKLRRALATRMRAEGFTGGSSDFLVWNADSRYPAQRFLVVGLGSGTAALALALRAVGVEAGDEVVTTPFTFFATVGAILEVGAGHTAPHSGRAPARKSRSARSCAAVLRGVRHRLPGSH